MTEDVADLVEDVPVPVLDDRVAQLLAERPAFGALIRGLIRAKQAELLLLEHLQTYYAECPVEAVQTYCHSAAVPLPGYEEVVPGVEHDLLGWLRGKFAAERASDRENYHRTVEGIKAIRAVKPIPIGFQLQHGAPPNHVLRPSKPFLLQGPKAALDSLFDTAAATAASEPVHPQAPIAPRVLYWGTANCELPSNVVTLRTGALRGETAMTTKGFKRLIDTVKQIDPDLFIINPVTQALGRPPDSVNETVLRFLYRLRQQLRDQPCVILAGFYGVPLMLADPRNALPSAWRDGCHYLRVIPQTSPDGMVTYLDLGGGLPPALAHDTRIANT